MKTETVTLAHEDWANAEGLEVKATLRDTVIAGKVRSAYPNYIFIEIGSFTTIGFSVHKVDGWIITYEKKIQTFMEAFDDAPIGTVWSYISASEKIIKVDSNRYFSSLSERTHDVALNAWSREPASNYTLTDKPQG